MRVSNWLKRLRECESGNVLVLGAAVMPMLVGSAALALDTIQLSIWKRQLQRQADSAALAGAYAVAQSKPAAAAVTRDLQLNDQVPLSEAAVVNNAPASGAYAGNAKAVEVILTSQRSLPFIAFFMSEAPTIEARSVAARVGGDNSCILALEKTEKEAILFNGNANVKLGCAVTSNSNHNQAAKITGNFKLDATVVKAVGKLDISNGIVPLEKQKPNSTAEVDPLGPLGRDLKVPELPTACTKTNYEINDKTETLNPGRYCGFLSINGKSNVTFNPGVYIIAGEFFKINGDSKVTGDGVTFILTSRSGKNATMDWNGNAIVDLKAPKSSSGSKYAGVLVMGDPAEPTSNKHNINGNLQLSMRGALYFPKGQVFWNGNTSVKTECLQIIARTVNINGNPQIPNTCTADDGAPGFLADKVRLVE